MALIFCPFLIYSPFPFDKAAIKNTRKILNGKHGADQKFDNKVRSLLKLLCVNHIISM